ncbi:acyltransferase family protein [Shimia ponticola]|uniref:acyltransferase family protein n=1 Tax=Shimia ponticola TaxID=2582893 RepID=UPI0011BE8BA0|nr:acyltransferase family protein [Shimia ponticola]
MSAPRLYRPEIDGLRCIAVLPVILFHAGFSFFSGGYVGVDVFFVISGYLITSILIRDLEQGRFSLLTFYERRARRILPALFVVVAACVPFAWAWMLPFQLVDFSQSVIAVALFASNFLFWLESDYFAPAAEEKPLLHTWSLAVEEQYYVVFPIFLLLVWRFGRRPVFWLVVLLSSISFAWAQWIGPKDASANFYLPMSRAWELLAGSLAAFISARHGVWSNSVLSALGLVGILVPIALYDSATPFPGVYAVPPVLGTVLIILCAGPGTIAYRLLTQRPMIWIGLISYSAYLWHQPLFAFARLRSGGEPSVELMVALCLFTLALAWASWRYVEQPFRGSSPILPQRKALFALSGLALGVMIVAGVPGILTKGMPQRFGDDVLQRQADISALASERRAMIGSGECQFNQRGKYKNIEDFVANWACFADVDAATGFPSFAVYGDSHAADRALALRLAGAPVTRLGGAGCPLLPGSQMAYCDALLNTFVDKALEQPHDFVVLVNRFQGDELTTRYLQDVVDFWSNRGEQILLLTAMPEFPNFATVYTRDAEMAANMHPKDTLLDRFDSAMAGVALPDNVQILNTNAVFCSLTGGICSPMLDGQPLLVDYGHLSPFGAAQFGDAALRTLEAQ